MNNKFERDEKKLTMTTIAESKNMCGNMCKRRRLRGGDNEETETEANVKNVHARKLEALKRAKKAADKNCKTKREPFKAGAVHHSIGSPFRNDAQFTTKSPKKQDKPKATGLTKPNIASGCGTRATTRATVNARKKNDLPKLAPANFKFQAPKGIAPLPISSHKQTKQSKINLIQFTENMEKNGEQKEKVSVLPSITTTPPSSTEIHKNGNMETAAIKKNVGSPLIVRKLDCDDTPEPIREPLVEGATSADQKTDVSKYRKELDDVIEKLENLCKEWTSAQEQSANLPNEVNDMVDVAIGQTKLLIKEKLAQYRELIDRCEKKCGHEKVIESDLEGFWEMVKIQVRNVISKFETLDVLKSNNWIEPKEYKTSLQKKTIVTKISKTKPVTGKSCIRDHIAALRRAKAAMQSNGSENRDRKPEGVLSDITSFVSEETSSNGEKQQIKEVVINQSTAY